MLTGKQRRYLRALGQRLAATLHVGRDGITAAVVEQAETQLRAQELIKVRMTENTPASRHETADELAGRTGAEVVQVLIELQTAPVGGDRGRVVAQVTVRVADAVEGVRLRVIQAGRFYEII